MSNLKISALLFDIGNTLINARRIMTNSLSYSASMLKEKGVIENEHTFLASYIYIDKQIQGPRINHLFSNVEIIKNTYLHLSILPSLYQIELFIGYYRNQVRKRIRRNQKLINFFTSLKSDGYKIGIVTDGTTTEQTEQLYKLGIMEFIDTCVTSEDMGIEKPEKSIFLKALSDLNIKRNDESMMIGDDYKRDILGANSLGIKTAFIKRYSDTLEFGDIKPDIILDDIYYLNGYIERL